MRPHVVSWLEGFLPGNVAALIAPTWFTCVGLAGVVTLFLMLAIARRHRIDPGVVASIVLWCYVAAVAAGILVPMTLDALEQLVTRGHVQWRWAGMTSFWGYLAGLGAVAAVCRTHRVPLARLGDLAAAPLGVALLFSRLGCFVAGCDYGKVTSVPWAVRFPAGSPAWHDHVDAGLVPASRAASLPVHPTELYEAALGVAIAVISLGVARSAWGRRGQGRVFLTAAATYAVGRIVVEAFRGDAGRGIYLGLSSGQIFSLLVLGAIGLGAAVRRARIATAVATATLVLALLDPHPAGAQAPAHQPAARPAGAQPAGSPADRPFGPALPPAPAPEQTAPARSATVAPTAASTDGSAPSDAQRSTVHVGGLLGFSAPINRRSDQVDSLAGGTLSVGLTLRELGLWLDLDSFANRDASHGSVLLSGSMMTTVANGLHIGGRFGFGATLVNFKDPVFRDVTGTAVRIEATAEYDLSRSWAVWVRPLSFDVLTNAALGGPITTWQIRVGLGYRFAVGHDGASSSSPSPASPAAPGPGAPAAPGPGGSPYPTPSPYPAPSPYAPGAPNQPYPAPAPYNPGAPNQPYPAPAPYSPGAPAQPNQPYPAP
ncbi:MAG TPA: prolipoprotein diacylglyceryl transferase family protein, partial [Kofleriaceae bacterium]|nr:prolipoprotein diacylglyceryl transferase family protein [Kofleriaceae bacterium]